ncbi:hypothetical protein [Natrinema salinisoli]|uniref:hypothetical protein n=1 Tax=Natrinema salinisoli TaxID=2878535 RepID=UPI001CEFBB51|nr:hypothetical protein [Natrinema salinisoli]
MNRRQYLVGAGTSLGAVPLVSYSGGATGHLSIDIVETSAPLEGVDLLDVTAELENSGSTDERVELDFIVGEDPVLVSERTVRPGTTVLFEADSELVDQQGSTHWYVGDILPAVHGGASPTRGIQSGRFQSE